MKTKRKFINVQPKTSKAKYKFIHDMDSLHAMVVQKETEDKYFAISINNRYGFWIPKEGNENWMILK